MDKFNVNEEQRDLLGKLIREKRLEKGLSQGQLAYKTGINNADIHRLEKGDKKKINPYYLRRVAEALDLDYKILYKMVDYLDEENTSQNLVNPLGITVIELPVYGAASAGGGAINMGNVVRKESFILLQGETMPKGAFAVEVSGDSMYPTLLDGDIAVVDPDCHDLDLNDEICLVTYEGQEYIKRVSDNENFINLMSDNSNRTIYKDIIILKTEDTDFKCHGIVVESKRKHKKTKKSL
ncbi:XRE family transcriptional regulator [Psychrilyobacter atlanticus]|uniref:XRE family transcriptional regulator n=1 Tax=Psychrilyobacter atlanticus TaxID=271091 RepID=UPI00040AA1DF|nr:S24 family peptidase [Psychrilyobacter atlanticus]